MEQTGKMQLEAITQQLRELAGLYRRTVADSGISENEFWIWYTLVALEGEHSQQSICSAWSLSKQTVNTIISHMARRGYVTLEPVPGTRNRKKIMLTDQGRAYGERIVLPVVWAEERALQRLPEKDLLVCRAALEQYIRILKEELYEKED